MRQALVRCTHCGRLYGVEYENTPPSRDNLVCVCGTERFEQIDAEQAATSSIRGR